YVNRDLNGLYGDIVTFANANNITDGRYLCCNVEKTCDFMEPQTRCYNVTYQRSWLQCTSINNSKFCASYGFSTLPGGLCGGILGDNNSTDKISDKASD